MTEVLEGRVARARRERLLAQFVDRSAEMVLFAQVLDSNELPIMVVSADAGMGKTSLMMRMVHECALRGLLKAELEWSSLDVLDYMSVMRKLRDSLGVDHFGAFTDLISYYTDTKYTPRLDINVNLQGGSVQVAGGAQISGSSVGDIAGVVLRDNMIVVQRPDINVPIEMRREQLTQRFLQGLKGLSAERKVVLFFSVTEKMSELTYQWLWEQLLKPVVDGALPNVRAILLGQRSPPADQDLAAFVAHAQLKPLGVDDIDAYIAKRIFGKIEVSDERRRGMAEIMADLTNGHPLEVASAVDKYLTKNGVPL
jgi:hypothetical protein